MHYQQNTRAEEYEVQSMQSSDSMKFKSHSASWLNLTVSSSCAKS